LEPDDLELLRGKQFAHLAVNRPDGPPHVSVVWIDASDDGHVLVNTAEGRAKDRLVRRDPRVSVTVHEEGNGYKWLRVEGVVVERVGEPEALAHIDAEKRRYRDGERWEPVPGQVRVMYRIRPDRILRRFDE
jgi:PPOX class probable F420-dependent enzyme